MHCADWAWSPPASPASAPWPRSPRRASAGGCRGGWTQTWSAPLPRRASARGSCGLARLQRRERALVPGRPQFPRLEVVDADRIQRHCPQLLELPAFLAGDPAFAHAFVEFRLERQRLDVAVLQCFLELAFDRFGQDHL